MAESESSKSKFTWIVVGGVVSLVFGVGGALLTNYLTTSSPQLQYTVSSVDYFPGQQNKLGVVTVDVSNPGSKEIESLECSLTLKDAKVKEPRCVGLPVNAFTLKNGPDSVVASVPFLNPKESFSLQVLVEPPASDKLTPTIDVRGKGILGKEISKNDPPRKKMELLPLIVGISAAMVANLSLARVLMQRSKLFSRLLGSVVTREGELEDALGTNKQDGIAFLLGINGLYDYAEKVRTNHRSLSWLTCSDIITELEIANPTNDEQRLQRVISVLDTVLRVDGIATSTKALTQVNVARLLLKAGKIEDAKSQIADALSKRESVVKNRCMLLNDLNALLPASSADPKKIASNNPMDRSGGSAAS